MPAAVHSVFMYVLATAFALLVTCGHARATV